MKRFLCIAILAAFTLAPPIATPDMPPDNVGAVQSATVSGLGYSSTSGNDTTGAIPEAYVSANVSAGAVPSASAVPGHNDIEKVTLKVDDYAEYEGSATATLTRIHRRLYDGLIDGPHSKSVTKRLYLLIRRKESRWKSTLAGGTAGAAGFGGATFAVTKWLTPIAPKAVAAATAAAAGIGATIGAAAGATKKKEYNEIDSENFGELDEKYNPSPGYLGESDHPYHLPFQVIDSKAELSGVWTINCSKPAKQIRGSGGERVYQHSHSHLNTQTGEYGSLHSE